MPTSSPLPSFRKPPVGEVLLALQFQQLDRLDIRHVGPLCERFGDRYPQFQTQPPLPPVVERFDGPRPIRGLTIDMMDPPTFPRLWLLDGNGEELVQLQRDRLMHNWRNTPIGSEYPRYPRLRQQFLSDWKVLEAFASDNQLGDLLPTQCEVAYINQIEASDGGRQAHADPSAFFSFFAAPLCNHGQSEFEAATFSSSGVAQEDTEAGAIRGRLFVELSSGVNLATKKLTYQLQLTLRGSPLSQDIGSVLQFFDFARARIVRAFAALTTPEMHTKWERLQ
jgi:uncharacterized protein (TIGR04255 family)